MADDEKQVLRNLEKDMILQHLVALQSVLIQYFPEIGDDWLDFT